MVQMGTFARNQTLRKGQNCIAKVRMKFCMRIAKVRLAREFLNKVSHVICELRMKWKWAFNPKNLKEQDDP